MSIQIVPVNSENSRPKITISHKQTPSWKRSSEAKGVGILEVFANGSNEIGLCLEEIITDSKRHTAKQAMISLTREEAVALRKWVLENIAE